MPIEVAGFFSVSYPRNVLILLEVYELRIDECAVKRFMSQPRAGERSHTKSS
jgi:hypothetical protein